MTRLGTLAGLALFAFSSLAVAADGDFNKVLRIGDAAPAWEALEGIDGRRHSLDELKDKDVVVVVFTCNDCVVAKEYEQRFIDFTAAHAKPGAKVAVVAVSLSKFSRAASSDCGEGFGPGRALKTAFTVGQPNPAARARIRTGSARSPFISRSTTSTGTAQTVASAAMVSSYFPALANSAMSFSPSLRSLCKARTAASAAV